MFPPSSSSCQPIILVPKWGTLTCQIFDFESESGGAPKLEVAENTNGVEVYVCVKAGLKFPAATWRFEILFRV